MNRQRNLRRRPAPAPLDEADGEALSPDPLQKLYDIEYRQYLAGRALGLMRAEFQPSTWQAFWGYVAEGRPGRWPPSWA
jgi:hypothetical protein